MMCFLILGCERNPVPTQAAHSALETPAGTPEKLTENTSVGTQSPGKNRKDKDVIFVNSNMESIHETMEREFLKAAGFGESRMETGPLGPNPVLAARDGSTWKIRSFDLLGIAMHEEPVVMNKSSRVDIGHQIKRMQKHSEENAFPEQAMQELKNRLASVRNDTSERPLNTFETAVLERFANTEFGPFLVEAPESGDDCLRMVGAIRARADCIQCHDDYKEGEALGAFVYLLQAHPGPPTTPDHYFRKRMKETEQAQSTTVISLR